MKDSIARDEARKALSREAVLRDAVAEWRAEENRRLWKLEEGLGYVEKDCPVCGHVTLMKQRWEMVLKGVTPTSGYEDSNIAERLEVFYCFTCGKTFKEEKGLVKNEG